MCVSTAPKDEGRSAAQETTRTVGMPAVGPKPDAEAGKKTPLTFVNCPKTWGVESDELDKRVAVGQGGHVWQAGPGPRLGPATGRLWRPEPAASLQRPCHGWGPPPHRGHPHRGQTKNLKSKTSCKRRQKDAPRHLLVAESVPVSVSTCSCPAGQQDSRRLE